MSEAIPQSRARSPRRRWDAFRRISAWLGVVEFVAVVVIIATLGHQLSGSDPAPETTGAIVLLLISPAILAGLVSGSRYLDLYAGYAEKDEATDPLSEADAARGDAANGSVLGDAWWGTLIAGIAGGLPGSFGLMLLFGPFSIIAFPFLALVVGIAWFVGWAIGAIVSLILSTVLGIIAGVAARRDGSRRWPWVLLAAFLPILLIAVAIPELGVRLEHGTGGWAAILDVLGFSVAGVEFVLPTALLWIARVAIWIAAVLFAALVMIGLPALLRRLELARAAATGSVSPSSTRRTPGGR